MRSLKIFTSETCNPCKTFKPVLMEAAKAAGMECVEVDININPTETAQRCVRGVPTTMLIENGVVLRRFTGSMNPSQLSDFIK